MHTSQKEKIFATNDPTQTPAIPLRPIISTAASANPTSGKIGERLSGETVILKLKKASTLKTNATRIILKSGDKKKKGKKRKGYTVEYDPDRDATYVKHKHRNDDDWGEW